MIYKSDEEKANLFASRLRETFTDDPVSPEFDVKFREEAENFVKNFDLSDNKFEKISITELEGLIKTLKIGSSPGEDGIHNIFLKKLPRCALELIVEIVNRSFEEGLPDSWKTGIITMIPKTESKSSSPADYRPISLTSCVGKLAERVVKARLYAYLENNKLLPDQQSGFRRRRSTADNLIFVTQKIQECINRRKKVCGIFFDISKAFDKVWHDGLIYKLAKLKVPVYLLIFIMSFLKDRSCRISVNKILSEIIEMYCGVPQGSVLGPLLFLAFFDIPLTNSKHVSSSVLFADDLGALFMFRKVSNKLIKRIRAYLKSLVGWLFKWRLKMNATKCCYTIFSGNGRGGIDLGLQLKDEAIPYSSNPTFLGIKFDEHLCFNKHFENLRARALKRLNIIKIFSHKSWHLSKKTLTCVYRALVGSIFDYSFFTVANCSETNMQIVQRVQNRAIRCIYKLPWDSPTDQLFPISGILPIRQRFTQLGSRYLAKALYFKNSFIINLVAEYIGSKSSITSRFKFTTPLCVFCGMVAITLCFFLTLAMNILSFRLRIIDLINMQKLY